MPRKSVNQHLVPDSHSCQFCYKTKADGKIFTVIFVDDIHYIRKNCSECRLIGTNTEQFNTKRKRKLELRDTKRESNSLKFKRYFKNKKDGK